MIEECAGDRAVEARGLLSMIDFSFALLLHLFCDVLAKIRNVSLQLQAVSLDTGKAVELVQNLIQCFTDMRMADDFSDSLYSAAEKQCFSCNIPTNRVGNSRRKRQVPGRLNDAIILSTTGQRDCIDNKTAHRPVLDCMSCESASTVLMWTTATFAIFWCYVLFCILCSCAIFCDIFV